MKKELIFLGPPACGKGTQTNRLSEYLGFPHVDTGSLLRAEIAKESEEGKIAKSFIDKGQLVPAELVGKIIAKKLAGDDCKNGYVLDGYPRSLEQARMLDEINADVVLWSGSHFGYVHDLTLNDDALKFKELIIISDDSAVIAPIIDREIIYSGVVNNWTVTSMSFKYNQASKLLHIDNCRWTNSSNNQGTTVTKVIGRY